MSVPVRASHRPARTAARRGVARASWLLQLLATLLLLVQPGLHLGHTDFLLASALDARAVQAGHAAHHGHHDEQPGLTLAGTRHDSEHDRHDCTCCLPTTPDLPGAVTPPGAAPTRAAAPVRSGVHVRTARAAATARGPPLASMNMNA